MPEEPEDDVLDNEDEDEEVDERDELRDQQIDASVSHAFTERGLINFGETHDIDGEPTGSIQLRCKIFPNSPNAEAEINAFVEEKTEKGETLVKSIQKTYITENTVFIWYYDI